MKRLYLIKYGELMLKGKNRKFFENKVINNIRHILKEEFDIRVKKVFGRLFLEVTAKQEYETVEDLDKHLIDTINHVFGLHSISEGKTLKSDKDEIVKEVIETVRKELEKNPDIKTFSIRAKRPEKEFPHKSVEMNAICGEAVLNDFPDLKVSLKNPDLEVSIEILTEFTFIYTKKHLISSGMPVGTAGDVLLLLSGGIDSPVAGYLAQKRGCRLSCLYFHAPPHTSEKAKEKVVDLARVLKKYQGKIRLYVVNFTETQMMLKKFTKQENFVILGRRMMMRIANKIAEQDKYLAFVTGESLGQVASQTLQNLHCVNEIADKPILRPLISYDKVEAMDLARKIGTYDISIRPYDDCCTLFLPPNPDTKANPKYLVRQERNVNIEALVDRAVETVEVIQL